MYYEAKIQLRPYKQTIYDFIYQQIKKYPQIWISKEEKLKTGIDIYISSQKFARSTLAPKIKRIFKAKVVISKQLYGRHKDKQTGIYRATVLIRT
ncbi:MAG TPA: NMD3-related protein [Candidatus Nanoarchaeia archaeon]|nr:NMD3-related protein [Candidatus Nanoarchaeia archaeon]